MVTRRVRRRSWPSPAKSVPLCGSATGRRRRRAGRWRRRSTRVLGVMLIEQLECVGDVGDVNLQPDTRCPLSKACGLFPTREAHPGELVDGFAEADVTFPA